MHPCCNGSLQTGVRIVAIVQFVLAIFTILSVSVMLTFSDQLESTRKLLELNLDTDSTDTGNAAIQVRRILIGLSIALISVAVIMFIGAVFLMTGANKRDIYYCTVWFILNVGSLAFSVVLFGIDLAFDEKSSMAGYITLEILDFLRQLYFLWVVGAFILELKEEDSTQPPYVDDLSTARNPYSV